MKKLICLILSVIMVSSVLVGSVSAVERFSSKNIDRDTIFNEAYAKIDWDAHYIGDMVLTVVITQKELTVDDFPLLDLTKLEEININGARIFYLYLENQTREEVRKVIDIIKDNYQFVICAEPNYRFPFLPDGEDFIPLDLTTDFWVDIGMSLGDTTCDYKLTVEDAVIILRYLAGSYQMSEMQAALADINQDDKITVDDAVQILRTLVA